MKLAKNIILLLFLCNIVFAAELRENKIKVVTTTTLISSIVKEIGGEKIDVLPIIPSGMCPGHFDLPISVVSDISKSKVFFYHGWERWLNNIFSNINKDLFIKKVSISGNWMVPEINKLAAEEIKKYLCEIDDKNAEYYKKRLDNYNKKIDLLLEKIKKDFVEYKGKKVICSEMQKEFLLWLGLDVVMTFGRLEESNVREIKSLIDISKKYNIKIIVDNLQNSSKSLKNIAKDIGAKYIVLSNFPEKSYFYTLDSNLNKLRESL